MVAQEDQNVVDGKKGTFADLLDGTFSLISHTWMTSLILGGVLFLPAAYIFGWAFGTFEESFQNIAEVAGRDPTSILATLGVAYLWIFLAALVQGVLYLFVRACVTEHASRAARGDPANTFSVALHVIRHTYLRLLGQRVLQMIILSVTLGGVALISSVAIGILAVFKLKVVAILAGVVLGLAGIGVFVWLYVRYTVTLESLVIDGVGIDQSFDRSMELVKHRWWRVFGYTLLFGLMISFATSLIATPIVFFSTIRQFMHALENALSENPSQKDFNAVFMEILSGLGRRLGILQYIKGLIVSFVTPVFMTLLFLELKKQPALSPLPQAVPPGIPGQPTTLPQGPES